MKGSGEVNGHTKILQQPTEPDNLLNGRSQSTYLSLDTGASNNGLLLGLPDNEGRTKEQTVASDRVTIIRPMWYRRRPAAEGRTDESRRDYGR